MSKNTTRFELPPTIEHHLAALSKLYGQEGKRQLQEIIVNAQIRVHEEWSSDNWDGGTYGHALYLVLPEPVFVSIAKQKTDVQKQIREDINNIHNVRNEFVDEVFIELEAGEEHDWRKESGLLLEGKRTVYPEALKRIWGDEGFRIFLSHKTEMKRETADLKERLRPFGITCFVAHEDIHPTKEWQDEIENALASMDGFIALMTEGFHDNDWTDQEIGFAFARSVPIIAVRLGKDPYGFIGKFQGLASAWQTVADDIFRILIKNERMFSAYTGMLRKCPNWDTGNLLGKALSLIGDLTDSQVDELITVYNETEELHGSFAFNGRKPILYGRGIVHHLNSLGPRRFKFSSEWLIEEVP